MLLRVHLRTLPKVFLLCLPKRASMTICPQPNRVLLHSCSCSLLYLCSCVDCCECHGLGRWQQRARWGHECRCWRHSKGREPTAVWPLGWLSVSCADSALAHQTLQLAEVYFKYRTNQESKWRISLSIHELLHSPSNRCHAIFIDFCHNNSRAD